MAPRPDDRSRQLGALSRESGVNQSFGFYIASTSKTADRVGLCGGNYFDRPERRGGCPEERERGMVLSGIITIALCFPKKKLFPVDYCPIGTKCLPIIFYKTSLLFFRGPHINDNPHDMHISSTSCKHMPFNDIDNNRTNTDISEVRSWERPGTGTMSARSRVPVSHPTGAPVVTGNTPPAPQT